MPALPVISGTEAVRAFSNDGWKPLGSVAAMSSWLKQGATHLSRCPITASLRAGTLRSLIRDAELTVEQFMALLHD